LRPGSRIISNNFNMKEWPADTTMSAGHRTLHKWIVPAWVAGEWRCVIDRCGKRQRITLRLQRHFQALSGCAWIHGREISLSGGRIAGDRIHFTLWHHQHMRPAMHFTGRVSGGCVRGKCVPTSGGDPLNWGGLRR
jgi:hypothetical protein